MCYPSQRYTGTPKRDENLVMQPNIGDVITLMMRKTDSEL